MSRSGSDSKLDLIVKLGLIWAMGLVSIILGMNMLYEYVQPPSKSPEPSTRPDSPVRTAASTGPERPIAPRRPPRRRGSDGAERPTGSATFTEPSNSAPIDGSKGPVVVKSLDGDGPRSLMLYVNEPGWGIRWKSDAWYFSVYVKDRKTSQNIDLIGPSYNQSTQGTRYYESTGEIEVKVKAVGKWQVEIVKQP